MADGLESRLPAGTAVVTVPSALAEGDGYFWSEIYDSGRVDFRDFADADQLTACLKGNSAILKKLLSDGAELSPKLAQAKAALRL
jgi:hypothetical protein